ncbi:MAG: signal peptidase I [Chloroflexi bacterium]|nr:signal peptidase I [Chloroflexota bacterium]
MKILAGATTALRRIIDLGLVVLIIIVLLGIILGRGASLVGRESIIIGGGSMEPAIGLGAAVLVAPVQATDLATGDVVSMQVGPERTMYTHRIVAIIDREDGRWIQTKGDANADKDPTLVPATAVVGRVELVVPYVGYLLSLLSLPIGVMFVLGLAATLLALAWLLESLELDGRPGRDATGADSEPAPRSTPATHPDDASALYPGISRGEPIAARQPGVAYPSGAFPWAPTHAFESAAPSRHTSTARPTVREQLDRSREVRSRRARWLLGRQRGRPAAD